MRPALAVLFLLAPAVATAQLPSRDAVPTQAPSIRGRVTAAFDNGPLRRAKLVLIADGRSSPPVYTDDAGAFELPMPARISYRIAVTKAGYVPLSVAAPGDATRPIVLAMVRGAVIRGKVTDMTGVEEVDGDSTGD